MLTEFDKNLYNITSTEFLNNSQKSKNTRKTLGGIFRLLRLNPKFIVEDVLNEYLSRRNVLVHGFWKEYLNTRLEAQAKVAIQFCNEFGIMSDNLESFFKGFLYFLALRHVTDSSQLDLKIKALENDFEYFINQVSTKAE